VVCSKLLLIDLVVRSGGIHTKTLSGWQLDLLFRLPA
jgi:hypothetical protein